MAEKKSTLTCDRLRALVRYDPDTGCFTRIARDHGVTVGRQAGNLEANGYLRFRVGGEKHLSHRLAWFYTHGIWPPETVDHINGDRADNRLCNLRLATFSENQQNRRTARPSSVGRLLGISRFRSSWQASISVGGKATWLGQFPTAEAAHVAYLEAKRRLHPFGTL